MPYDAQGSKSEVDRRVADYRHLSAICTGLPRGG